MKYLALVFCAVALAGCGEPGSTVPAKFNGALPSELKDCKVYKVTDGINSLYITRCPETTSTTNPAKGGSSTTINNSPAVPTAADERNAKVDALLRQIDDNIARLEAQKKDLK